MRLEVYGEEEQQDVVRLKLDKKGKDIFLQVVDRDGGTVSDATLLTINSDGTLSRWHLGLEERGFVRDDENKITLQETE